MVKIPGMRVRVLGELEVVVGDRVADLGGPKPRTLFALLVAAQGRAVAVEHLIDQIWGEDPPVRVEASLQSYVARLRRALEPERAARRPAERLRTHAGGYSLDIAAGDVDARRFAELVRDGRADREAAPAQAGRLLAEGLGLWRGEAYAGVPAQALAAEIARLDELRLSALEDMCDVRIRLGSPAEAVSELERLVRLHPLREKLWVLLARALYAAARQGDALAAVRRAREHLADELGVDPGVELRQVEEMVLRQDPALELAAPAPMPNPGDAVVVTGRSGAGIFGRDEALCATEQVLHDALHSRGRTVIVSGEPGIGKTRFAEALIASAGRLGFDCGWGGWEADACPPLWGWSGALRQLLGTDVLFAPPGVVVDAASASFRQAEALTAALRDRPPALLVLDDLHWADAESLRLLRRVSSQVSGLPLVLVLGIRSATAEWGTAVVDALAALARTDPLRVELTGLDAAAIAAWVEEYAGMRVSGTVAAELATRTDGNPFYVTELVRLLVRDGALGSVEAPAWRSVPGGVRDVVRQRLAQLPESSARVIATAAVLGRTFDLLVVAKSAEISAGRVEEAVESALMLGLVEACGPGEYRFTHALVRDAVYEGLPAPTRARTHAAVGVALEYRHAGEILAHVAELAEHYRLAGPAYARSAWVFARRAGLAAAEQSAHDEALRLLTEAAALQEVDPLVTAVEREQVALGQATALVRLGRPIEAWPAVAGACTSALDRDDPVAAVQALLTITASALWGWRNAFEYDDDAIRLWETALARLPEGHPEFAVQLRLGQAMELLYRPGSAQRATELVDEALHSLSDIGAGEGLRCQALRMAEHALMRPDLLQRRMVLHDELVELATALGDAAGLAAALTGRATDRIELGRLRDGHADLLRADELARGHRLPQHLLVAGWGLAMWRQINGDLDGAEAAIAELEAFEATLAMAGRGIGLCQLAQVRLHQGRLSELEPILAMASRGFPPFRDWHALALVQAGRLDEARRLLGAWADQPALPWNYLWPGFTVIRAYTWIGLGDRSAIADLRAQLTPHAGSLVVGSVATFFLGSMHLVLGRLAEADDDPAAARAHFEQARAVHGELGLGMWLEHADQALAGLS
jgi:DNA-binding SARP family transcriptional activator